MCVCGYLDIEINTLSESITISLLPQYYYIICMMQHNVEKKKEPHKMQQLNRKVLSHSHIALLCTMPKLHNSTSCGTAVAGLAHASSRQVFNLKIYRYHYAKIPIYPTVKSHPPL